MIPAFRYRHLAQTVLIAGALTIAVLTDVAAATFTVNPTKVYLSRSVTSRVLTVRNESQQPLRFQVTVMAWHQSPDGEMQLAPTRDIAAFPPLVALAPGESRSVRIGFLGTPGAQEISYRVFVEEMPPLPGQAPTGGVTVLTRIGVPIFVRPDVLRAAATITEPEIVDGRLRFEVRNDGNVHFVPDAVLVRISSTDGELLAEQQLSAWYILAAECRQYAVDMTGFPPAVQVDVEMAVNGTRVSSRWSGASR